MLSVDLLEMTSLTRFGKGKGEKERGEDEKANWSPLFERKLRPCYRLHTNKLTFNVFQTRFQEVIDYAVECSHHEHANAETYQRN